MIRDRIKIFRIFFHPITLIFNKSVSERWVYLTLWEVLVAVLLRWLLQQNMEFLFLQLLACQ